MGAQGAGPDRDRATSKACWFLYLLEHFAERQSQLRRHFWSPQLCWQLQGHASFGEEHRGSPLQFATAVVRVCVCVCVYCRQMERAAGVIL